MIVVDTNIIAYYCIGGTMTAAAERLALADSDWRSPELWRSEMRNILAGAVRRHGVSSQEAIDAMEKAERKMAGRHDAAASEWVLRLIVETACTAYDLEFVALAHQLQVPLYTMDRELLRTFPAMAFPLA